MIRKVSGPLLNFMVFFLNYARMVTLGGLKTPFQVYVAELDVLVGFVLLLFLFENKM